MSVPLDEANAQKALDSIIGSLTREDSSPEDRTLRNIVLAVLRSGRDGADLPRALDALAEAQERDNRKRAEDRMANNLPNKFQEEVLDGRRPSTWTQSV